MKTLEERIKKHEGYMVKPYTDTLGFLTGGYGNKVEDLPCKAKEIIIEMVYQMGESGVSKFRKMWKALKQNPKDYSEAANQMMDSRWAKQTYNRARNLSDEMRSISNAS